MALPLDSGRSLVTTPVRLQIGEQQVEAAEVEIAAEDQPHPFGFLRDDGELLVLGLA